MRKYKFEYEGAIMNEKAINVTKTVSEEFDADCVKISLSAVGEAKKYAAAVAAADEVANAVVGELMKIELTPRMHGISVNAVRADHKITGYRAVRTFTVEFDMDAKRLGEVTELLADSACEWRASFTLKESGVRKELLSRAVKCAREAAEIIAAAANVKLGKLVKVEYGAPSDMPVAMYARAVDGMGSASPERITVSESVSCAWEIE